MESSGRPSSHTNVLDALHATEIMTAPSVSHANFGMAETAGRDVAGWESLATFAYGPRWKTENRESDVNGSGTDTENGDGWRAPYLDIVPSYPVRHGRGFLTSSLVPETEACLDETDADKAEERIDNRADSIPDVDWGSFSMKATEEKKESPEKKGVHFSPENERPAKKIKIQHGDASTPSFVPKFLPKYPPLHTYGTPPPRPPDRSPVEADETTKPSIDSSELHHVRGSLVRLSENYWGSQAVEEKRNQSQISTSLEQVAVPFGQIDKNGKEEEDENGGGGQEGSTPVVPGVAPLNKASGSRISRILEGSMDAAT